MVAGFVHRKPERIARKDFEDVQVKQRSARRSSAGEPRVCTETELYEYVFHRGKGGWDLGWHSHRGPSYVLSLIHEFHFTPPGNDSKFKDVEMGEYQEVSHWRRRGTPPMHRTQRT